MEVDAENTNFNLIFLKTKNYLRVVFCLPKRAFSVIVFGIDFPVKNFLKLRPRSHEDRGPTRFLKFFAGKFFERVVQW